MRMAFCLSVRSLRYGAFSARRWSCPRRCDVHALAFAASVPWHYGCGGLVDVGASVCSLSRVGAMLRRTSRLLSARTTRVGCLRASPTARRMRRSVSTPTSHYGPTARICVKRARRGGAYGARSTASGPDVGDRRCARAAMCVFAHIRRARDALHANHYFPPFLHSRFFRPTLTNSFPVQVYLASPSTAPSRPLRSSSAALAPPHRSGERLVLLLSLPSFFSPRHCLQPYACDARTPARPGWMRRHRLDLGADAGCVRSSAGEEVGEEVCRWRRGKTLWVRLLIPVQLD
ncbi:hypothetical protein B0H16DRAFT_1904049, partial [Mycena metata]